MFVLATMVAPTVSGPIKIRNMSPNGALIEGNALPRIGEQVSLRRGDLSAAGRIIWREPGKAGLRFDHDVQVTKWLPAAGGKQQQVDRTFDELKADPGLGANPSTVRAEAVPANGWELLDLAGALDALADELAGDAEVVAHHASSLQTLDIASQQLRKIAASMANGSSKNPHDLSACASQRVRVY